jgi:hypothetical protein
MDKWLYTILEKTGEGIEKLYWFCSNNKTEVIWFSAGVLSVLAIQLIF